MFIWITIMRFLFPPRSTFPFSSVFQITFNNNIQHRVRTEYGYIDREPEYFA